MDLKLNEQTCSKSAAKVYFLLISKKGYFFCSQKNTFEVNYKIMRIKG